MLSIPFLAINESRNGRIIGGNDAVLGQFPHQVSIRAAGTGSNIHFCGGVVMNNRWVLTTARCTMNHLGTSLQLVFGSIQVTGGLVLPSARSIRHPNFNRDTRAFDISLVQTTINIMFSANIQPIALGSNFVGGGVNAVVSGFGFWRNENPVNSQILQYLRTTTLTNSDCSSRLANTPLQVFDHSICAFTRENEGTCERDNGGGLVADGSLIGLVR